MPFALSKWLVCSKCERLGVVGKEFTDPGKTGPKCTALRCGGRGIPTRFVVVCFKAKDSKEPDRQLGHIDDFPWIWWAHSLKDSICRKPQLKFETSRNTTALAGLTVRCYSDECEGRVGRSMEGVFGAAALIGFRCNGIRPWLNDREDCGRPQRVLLRGASNVYFAVTASAISIPPYSSNLNLILEQRCEAVINNVGSIPMETLLMMAKNAVPEIRNRYSDAEIQKALERLAGCSTDYVPPTERQQRSAERKALIEGRTEEEEVGSEFVAIAQPRETLAGSLQTIFRTIVRVKRLREVRVLRGFQRVSSITGTDPFSSDCAPISRYPKDWLPAIEVRGEGIYLELDADRVRAWESTATERAAIVRTRCQNSWDEEGFPYEEERLPTARFILIHTLSHLIMRQLSLQCGYSSASLREKLYVGVDGLGNDELGVLIYTATTGSDGTLGGLERQGNSARFEKTFLNALDSARWCSSDPLCIESRGQGADALNLSACHACCLVSETSCEERNLLLDRGLLTGTPSEPQSGFFSPLLQAQ